MSDHHPILSSHPRWLQHREQEEKLDEARQAWQERRTAARVEYERDREEWRQSRIAALRSGQEPPREPEFEDDAETGHWFLQEQTRLRKESRELLADLADEIEAEARKREEELLSEASEAIDRLHPIRDEWAELLGTVNSVRAARDSAANVAVESRTRTRQRLSVAELVDLIERSRLPLDPLPRRR